MRRQHPTRSAAGARPLLLLGTLLLAGCALIQPPPIPRMPRLGQHGGPGDAACVTALARAHGALAAAGAAAGDPQQIAAAHAAHAVAMSEYHTCLARPGNP